jgi:glycerol-3-phosphate O-acyltransferase 3/4
MAVAGVSSPARRAAAPPSTPPSPPPPWRSLSRSSTRRRREAASRVAAAAVAAALPMDGLAFDLAGGEAAARGELQARVEAALIEHLVLDGSRGGTGDLLDDGRGAPRGAAALLGDCLPLFAEGVADVVDDSFSQCFEATPPRIWNWGYLAPFYALGLAVRYLVLFPCRLAIIGLASIVLAVYFAALPVLGLATPRRRSAAMTYYAQALMLAFGAVVTYHGARPRRCAGQVYAANHTTMLDFVFMLGLAAFSVVGQKHGGLVGFFQDHVFDSLQCLWFDRSKTGDRSLVRRRIQQHVADPDVPPLCVFPEGTCVNNRYALLFKVGAFELDDTAVVPVAVHYDKSFASGFWDSRNVSFIEYLGTLMTQWCLVVDIYFMPPETRGANETPREFAARVKEIIAAKAGLISVEFDGYFKHNVPGERYKVERQRRAVSSVLAHSRER